MSGTSLTIPTLSANAHRSGSARNRRKRRGSGSANAREAGENDESRGDGAIPRPEPETRAPSPRPRFAQSLKQLFRQLAEVLTLTPPQRQERKKRRQEETGKAFRLSALNIMRPIMLSIFDDPAFWHPPDVMDEAERIRQWHANNIDVDHLQESESFHYSEQNHLSLNL
jgi:hypothetical protein